MLSALLCALAAPSGYGPFATPRPTATLTDALVHGFQPKDLNTVPHSTRAPAQLARPTDFSRQLLRAFSSPGFDGSNGAYCTSDNVSSRAVAATTRPDSLAVDVTNLTKPIPAQCPAGNRVGLPFDFSCASHTSAPLTECVAHLRGRQNTRSDELTAPQDDFLLSFCHFL